MTNRATEFFTQLFAASPLRLASFRRFYIGSMAVALGYTMQATVAAWLMATLTTSALMVALVQTASTAPSLLFGLLAGTLADIVNRRRIILATQLVLLAATAGLGISALFGLLGPVALLIGTFLIGAGFTIYLPAQQASINDLVTRADLPRALGLGAVAFNLARAVGPALAGALAAWVGSGSALLTSALFFAVMIVALRGWRGSGNAIPGVPETLWSGIQSGLRYARHSPPMRALILRNLTFCTCASALWALLPVIARDQLGLGAGGFGLLSASLGIGAIIGALYIPPKLHRIPLNTVVTAGVALWVVATLVIAAAENLAIAVAGACVAGAAWVPCEVFDSRNPLSAVGNLLLPTEKLRSRAPCQRPTSVRLAELRQALQKHLVKGSGLSVSAIATEFGVTRSFLRYRFPDLCKSLSLRSRSVAQERTRLHHQRQALRVKATVRRIRKSGQWPSYRKMEKLLRQQNLSLSEQRLRDVYKTEIDR